ncbi:MAG TPA: hypothetical protein VE685_23615 [Thermoanaerobaculia bacterium]|nr:hypothetical protein [Thermoanaerobaculia bacterium]
MKEAEALRDTATVEDLQGPFLLGRLPEPRPVQSREEAWRQDLDVVLTRFLPYDRSFSEQWGATIAGEPVGDELDMWAEGGGPLLERFSWLFEARIP